MARFYTAGRVGLQACQPISIEYRDGKVEIEPRRQQMKLARRGKHQVLVAPVGSPPLSEETVRRTLQQVRTERTRKALKPDR